MSRGGSRGRWRAAWFSVREKRLGTDWTVTDDGNMRLGWIKGIPSSKWKAGVMLHRIQESAVNGMNPSGSHLKIKMVGSLR